MMKIGTKLKISLISYLGIVILLVLTGARIDIALVLALLPFGAYALFTNENFREWDRRRIERNRQLKELKSEEYAKEMGRLQARRDMREEENYKRRMGEEFTRPGPLMQAFFPKQKRKK